MRTGAGPVYLASSQRTKALTLIISALEVTTVKIADVKEGQQHIDLTGEVVESAETYERFMGLDFGRSNP